MDWAKAKRGAILLFLFLNVFLAIIFEFQKRDLYYLTKKEFANIKTILEKDNITFETKAYPKDFSKKPYLKYAAKDIDTNTILISMFSKNNVVRIINKYIEDDKELEIKEDGRIIYNNYSTKAKYKNIKQTKAKELTNRLVSKISSTTGVLKLRSIYAKEGKIFIEYNSLYKGEYIFDSYMKFIVSDTGIEHFELNVLDVGITTVKERNIKFLDEILYIFMKDIRDQDYIKGDIKIEKVDLGYSKEKRGKKEGRLAPKYKITYYIDETRYAEKNIEAFNNK